MPNPPKRKQRLGQYPTHWITLVSKVAGGSEIPLEFPTWFEASNIRWRFYHFRDALELEARSNSTLLPSFQEAELVMVQLTTLNPCLSHTVCRKRKRRDKCDACNGPAQLLFQNRDLVSEGALLSKALEKLEEPESPILTEILTGESDNA